MDAWDQLSKFTLEVLSIYILFVFEVFLVIGAVVGVFLYFYKDSGRPTKTISKQVYIPGNQTQPDRWETQYEKVIDSAAETPESRARYKERQEILSARVIRFMSVFMLPALTLLWGKYGYIDYLDGFGLSDARIDKILKIDTSEAVERPLALQITLTIIESTFRFLSFFSVFFILFMMVRLCHISLIKKTLVVMAVAYVVGVINGIVFEQTGVNYVYQFMQEHLPSLTSLYEKLESLVNSRIKS